MRGDGEGLAFLCKKRSCVIEMSDSPDAALPDEMSDSAGNGWDDFAEELAADLPENEGPAPLIPSTEGPLH